MSNSTYLPLFQKSPNCGNSLTPGFPRHIQTGFSAYALDFTSQKQLEDLHHINLQLAALNQPVSKVRNTSHVFYQ